MATLRKSLLLFITAALVGFTAEAAVGGEGEFKGNEATQRQNTTANKAEEDQAQKEDSLKNTTTPSNTKTSGNKSTEAKKENEPGMLKYNFLFQLFYKYSLSDFFEFPSFQEPESNYSIPMVDWQHYLQKLQHSLLPVRQ